MEIRPGDIKRYSKSYRKDKTGKIVTNAISKSGINAVAFNSAAPAKMRRSFSVELESLKVTNQKSSGRCWLFAALNMLRDEVIKHTNMEYFEFSQNYQAFWDKFEKANYFLESIIETAAEPLEGRLVTWLLQNAISDGGQWDMFVSITEKYGVVPKEVMPETFHSGSTSDMNRLITIKLRRNAMLLRDAYKNGASAEMLLAQKDGMLSDLYKLFCMFFGEPPLSFDYEYRDKDKAFHEERGITPVEFYKKYVKTDLNEYVSIINAPTADKPYGKTYTVRFLGNVAGGRPVIYYNTDMETMKHAAISQLNDGKPVWFGCDVGKMMERDMGMNELELFEYDLTLGTSFALSKAERLDYRESCMTHAMVFRGVNLVNGRPDRWKVENSWGEDRGEKGYFVMSDRWFDEFMYQVVVNKKYLSAEILEALKDKPLILEPWDPMGSLA